MAIEQHPGRHGLRRQLLLNRGDNGGMPVAKKEDAIAGAVEVSVTAVVHDVAGIGLDLHRAMHQFKKPRHAQIHVLPVGRYDL